MMHVSATAVRTATLAAVAVAALLAIRQPLERTMPVYGELAGQLRTGPLSSSFEPLGYPWLIAMMPFEPLDDAVKALHLASYAALAALVLLLSRRGEPLSLWSFLAFAWILFNPYVLLNMYRLNDNGVIVVAILAVFALIWYRGAATRYAEWATAGSLIGALALIRPNVISLLPVLWIAAWYPSTLRRPAWHATLATIALLTAYVACSLVITGEPAFRPGNGPYNLFAGNNPFAADALRTEYNAEPSLMAGLDWCGAVGATREIPAGTYLECSARFVREAPGAAATVAAFKWYNLMWRPNLRLADSPAKVVIQVIQLLPSWLWWAATTAVLLRRRRLLDPVATTFVLMFGLPFVLTNSDPRFRLPLDAVYALSLTSPQSLRRLRDAVAGEAVPSSAL